MPPQGIRIARALLLVGACVPLAAVGGAHEGLLMLLPAALLLGALLAGWYPGERAIERVRTGPAPRRAAPRAIPALAAIVRDARVPRGGLLMAASLAKRPPPAPA